MKKLSLNLIIRGLLGVVLFSPAMTFAQYDGLVINEVLPNPRNSSGVELDSNTDGEFSVFDDEFIELMNTSTNPIDVAGLWLTDAYTNIRRHVFSSRVLPPGGSIVVFGGGSLLNFSNPPAQIATGGSLSLNNNADETIYLFSPQTTIVDQVSFHLTASHDAISLARNPDGTGVFTNHYKATTNLLRMSPGRPLHGGAFLTNQPPVLLDLEDQTAFVEMELEVPVRAYDPADRDSITLYIDNYPSNAMLSSTGGVGTFTFTPTEDQAGQTINILFIAEDADGAETNTVSFQIINPNADEDIWINEIHYDNVGTDTDEGVEIAGTAASILSEYSLILYNGNGSIFTSNALTGTLDDEQCGFGAAWFGFVRLQNETEGIALVKGTNVLQFLSYEGTLTATNGPAEGMTSIDIGVRETAVTVGYSLQLEGTGTVYSSFAWASAQPHSRGTLNSNQTIVCLSPPAIEIEKTVYLGHDGGTGGPGIESVQGTNSAPLTYLFRVSNTGGMVLTNVTITDVALNISPIVLGTLASGEISTSYVEAVLSGDLRNTAVVSGEDPDGLPVTDQDTAEVVEIIPSINIQKTVFAGHDDGASCPGSDFLYATNGTPVTYCFVVENNGNTNINSITITDIALGISPIPVGTLLAGGMFSTSVTAVVTGSLTNLAVVNGIDPNSDPLSDQDSAIVQVITPALQLEKTVYLGHDRGASFPGGEQVSGLSGAEITYCFDLSNTGDTTLTNVTLSDPGLAGFPDQDLGTLATGEISSLYYETTLTASFINTATATAFSVIGSLVTDVDSAEVELTTPVVTNWNLQYEVVDLGTLGGTVSEATGINDRGEVVGWSIDSSAHTQAFHWQNGQMTGLGFLPGGTSSIAYAINDSGDITGQSHVSATNYHAFLYRSNAFMDLGTFGGANSAGYGINAQADASGYAYAPPADTDDFSIFWWRTNAMVQIVPYHLKGSAIGYGINDHNRIAGYTVLDIPAQNRVWAMVWHDDNGDGTNVYQEMKVLGAMGGEWSIAHAINNANQVVGWASITNPSAVHAFLITPSNGNWKLPTSDVNKTNLLMQNLGALETPSNNSDAHALNDLALVVGTSTSTTGVNQAFLWREGVMTNLNQLIAANSGWVLTNATGINELNEICGTGLYEGQKRAFLLRQGGRISKITSLMVPNGLKIFTNEFMVVETQQLERVDTQVIEWVGVWNTNTEAVVDFTVEYCDPLGSHNWQPFPDTQWPITKTYWTNTNFEANHMRFFRIRAD